MRVSFRTADGAHYLRAYQSGVVAADATAIGELDETFTLSFPFGDERCALEIHGKYVRAHPEAEAYKVSALSAEINAEELWRMVQVGHGVAFASAHGLYLCAEDGGGGVVVANREKAREWETFSPVGDTPAPTPDPPPLPGVHLDPLRGQVREVNGAFGDATGPRNVCALHLGDLIGQGLTSGLDHILPALDFAAECGYHVVRSWWQLHTVSPTWWDNKPAPRWDPRSNPALFAAILSAGAARGLKWHLAAGALKGMGQHDKDSLFDCLADAVGQVGLEAFALIEGANEARDTTDETPASLERLVQRVRSRHPGGLYSLTAYTGHEDREIDRQWTPSWQGFVMRHCYRGGHFHDKNRHIFSGAYEGVPVRRKHWRGEPFGTGPGVSAQENGHELTADTMPMAGAMAAMTRCVWTFMSTPGVIYGRERLEHQPGIRETPRLLRALPQDVGTFRTLGHSGPSKQGLRIHAVRADAPDVRADYAIADDGRYVEQIYGPPSQRKDLPQERVTWDRVVLHDCSWGRVETGRLS